MKTKLFWVGLGFQIIQMGSLGILFLSKLDWSFLTSEFFIWTALILLNIMSFVFMLKGASGKEED
jgi:hypothetical protein